MIIRTTQKLFSLAHFHYFNYNFYFSNLLLWFGTVWTSLTCSCKLCNLISNLCGVLCVCEWACVHVCACSAFTSAIQHLFRAFNWFMFVYKLMSILNDECATRSWDWVRGQMQLQFTIRLIILNKRKKKSHANAKFLPKIANSKLTLCELFMKFSHNNSKWK